MVFVNIYKPISDEVNIETPMNWNGYGDVDLISKSILIGKPTRLFYKDTTVIAVVQE